MFRVNVEGAGGLPRGRRAEKERPTAAAPGRQGILPALVGLLLEPKTRHPLLRHVLVALRAILRFPVGDYGWLLARSDARSKAGKTVLDRLRQIAIDLRLLNHQRLVRGRPTLNDLARDMLSAMHDDLEKTSHHDRARERRGQGRKRVIQRRFNVGVLEATPERKASTL